MIFQGIGKIVIFQFMSDLRPCMYLCITLILIVPNLFLQEFLYNAHYLLKALTTDTFDLTKLCFKSRKVNCFSLFSEQLIPVLENELCKLLAIHLLDSFVGISIDDLFLSHI